MTTDALARFAAQIAAARTRHRDEVRGLTPRKVGAPRRGRHAAETAEYARVSGAGPNGANTPAATPAPSWSPPGEAAEAIGSRASSDGKAAGPTARGTAADAPAPSRAHVAVGDSG